MNIAAVRKCPVIFLCRNNGLAISTPISEQYIGDGIAARGIGYGIETLRVDGTDIFAVYEATREARRRALTDGGRPILLELMSYRVSHHSTSDDSFVYRNRADVQGWVDQYDPITRLRQWLERKGLWNVDMDKEARKNIRKAVLAELTAAEKEKKPPLDSIFSDVYAELSEEMQAQREELRRLMTKYPAEYDFNEHKGGLEAL